MKYLPLLFLWALPLPLSALEAGLETEYIEVRADFSGTQLLVFGSLARDRLKGEHVAILVRGPDRSGIIRKKVRMAGLWVNKDMQSFERISGFYALANSATQNPPFKLLNGGGYKQAHVDVLKRLLADRGLFSVMPESVVFLGRRLFRAEIDLPPTAPIGDYQVTIALWNDRTIIRQVVRPLHLNRTGWGQTLFWFSREWSFFYGLFSILLAFFVGWAVPVFLRRLF